MTATHEKNSGAMRSARLMFWTTGVFWFSQYATTPFLNAELQRMGVSAAFMGLVAGLYGLSQMLLRLPLGMAADRMGRQRPFIVLGCGLLTVAGFGFLKWYTPHSFLWLRALMGVSSSAWVSFTVLYGSYYPATEAPRRISQLNVANQSGRLLCYTLGAWLVAGWGVRSAFWMGALSAAQLALFREFFPAPGGAIDHPAMNACFEQFANGELRSPLASDRAAGVGEPNGAAYFLFAEFAFLCVESGIDAGDWLPALRSFVATQEIFMHVYRPGPKAPPAVGAAVPRCGSRGARRRPRSRRSPFRSPLRR